MPLRPAEASRGYQRATHDLEQTPDVIKLRELLLAAFAAGRAQKVAFQYQTCGLGPDDQSGRKIDIRL